MANFSRIFRYLCLTMAQSSQYEKEQASILLIDALRSVEMDIDEMSSKIVAGARQIKDLEAQIKVLEAQKVQQVSSLVNGPTVCDYNLFLTNPGEPKAIPFIKALRTATNGGLAESKQAFDARRLYLTDEQHAALIEELRKAGLDKSHILSMSDIPF